MRASCLECEAKAQLLLTCTHSADCRRCWIPAEMEILNSTSLFTSINILFINKSFWCHKLWKLFLHHKNACFWRLVMVIEKDFIDTNAPIPLINPILCQAPYKFHIWIFYVQKIGSALYNMPTGSISMQFPLNFHQATAVSYTICGTLRDV